MTTLKDIQAAIPTLTADEILALNKSLNAALKNRRERDARLALAAFCVGDKVEFTHPQHGVLKGVVESINVKTASIGQIEGHFSGWRVPPAMLRKVA